MNIITDRVPENPLWPDGLTRVPYWAFQSAAVYKDEQTRLFQGPHWNYLCLEAEIPEPGDFKTSFIGETSIVVTRDSDGELYAFENRCAHRGALLALEDSGKAKDFTCVYHAWSYNLQGDLTGIAFKDGIKGNGGMAPSFCMEQHGPRKLRVATVHGLVFGSFSDDVPDIEEYLGEEILSRIERVLGGRKPVVLGRFTQMLPNNWKLYIENVKDSYHASILHLFFTTFEINRLSQRGAIIVDESGGHHVSYSAIDREAERQAERDASYAEQSIRSDSAYQLQDPSLLEGFSEVGDDVTLQILSIFPCFVLQQIQNSVAVRQVLPRGVETTQLNWTYLGFEDDTPEQRLTRLKQANLVGPAGYISMEDGCVGGFVQRGIAGASNHSAVLEMGGIDAESSDSRITEASIRGFWKAYRAAMDL
ncbi:aromatic ring-hydroxylating dioxygenase subunit alpha [Pseudomonas azerbaijanoccidens]|jgi:anthranilate 1,2-dioxygenase large subunit|uniref:aromatic ring-hydroxylating dioxygenase subunit alpha n=1 Tax=Pseudomonas azerbaijanoccidentalis TaxID=2842347 RepID=UPI000F99BC47|nr:aromatic ring-hydroxylating dioxygenase subunit alpha [Pseudomonas azerbaijanoccidentalis]MCK8663836.1 aromatic ring-hydroxylating dioxygenase subunit alpha [Pseudomonas azerbaijanoccidentalis]